MIAAILSQGSGSAVRSDPDWRCRRMTIAARFHMRIIIWETLLTLLGKLMTELPNHVDAVESELFRQSKTMGDYINKRTLRHRIMAINRRMLENYVAPMPEYNGRHAEANNVNVAQFEPVSSLVQTIWPEQSGASMWKCPQEIQGMVIINEQLPPQATGPAEYLVSPVGSSTGSMANCYPPYLVSPVGSPEGSTANCYPPYLVSPVGSPEGSTKLFNRPCPFHNSSVDDPWATLPNHVSAPHALSSGTPGSQYLQGMNSKNIINIQDESWTDQSGTFVRKYQQSMRGGILIDAPLPHLVTDPNEYLASRVGSSSSNAGNPPCHPYNSVIDYGWTIPQNSQQDWHGLPCGNNSSGIPGRRFLPGTHGENNLFNREVLLNSAAVVGGEYLVSPVGASYGSSTFNDSPYCPAVGPVSGGGINLQDGQQARHGLTFGNYSSESATTIRRCNLTEQSGAAHRRQYARGKSGEHISHDHGAALASPAIVGVEYPVRHAGISYGSTSTFSNTSPCPVFGSSGSERVSLKNGIQAHLGLSSGNDSSESEASLLCRIFAVEQSGASGRNCPQASLGVIIPRSDERAMKDVPSSVPSIVGTSGVDLLKKHEWADERLSSLQQLSESLCPAVPVLDELVIIDLTNDDTCQSNPEVGSDRLGEVSGLNPADDLKPGSSPKEPVICYELMDVDKVLPGGGLDAISPCKEPALSTEEENISVPVVHCDEHKTLENEIWEIKNFDSESVKMESTNLSCVSLTEVMSEEQIVEHLFSLRKRIEKVSEEEGTESFSENTCQLCREQKIFLEPSPCSFCWQPIKKNRVYYSPSDETDFKLCRPCYSGSGERINSGKKTYGKEQLHKRRTNEGPEEAWVQCDKCKGWQHQVCTLYNQQIDKGGAASYTCPTCYVKEIKSGQRLPSSVGALSAENLPRTALSDHIEQRLSTRLMEDRERRANSSGNGFFEVPGAENLTVRVVLTEKKDLKVKKEFLDLFNQREYPSEFPYISKMILLFQKIGFVDVILFGFYVQEYGSDCGDPNQRCVYISYLDSIKYFMPTIATTTGESLRTFAYHEVLIGYLDYCKKRGFVSCYIWACPPREGQDYLFYHHPGNQKTPKAATLREWYKTMIQKAIDEKVVVSCSNIYDYHFCTSSDSRYQVSTTKLPYFDGDSWFDCTDIVLKEVDEEAKSNYQRKRVKIGSKHNPKAMRRTDALYDSKEFLFMQKFGKILQPKKKDYIVMHLQFVCTHCHRVIASGIGWFCSGCADFRLCERCHNDESNVADSHRLKKGEEHFLSEIAVDVLPSSTEDGDGTIKNILVRNRQTFLKFCQEKHYQFNTLRRAKHSSMMVLHFLSYPTDLSECSICAEASLSLECWTCKMCPGFNVCRSCHGHRGISHCHALTCESDS